MSMRIAFLSFGTLLMGSASEKGYDGNTVTQLRWHWVFEGEEHLQILLYIPRYISPEDQVPGHLRRGDSMPPGLGIVSIC
jgi:hypothetical protein